MSSPRRRLAVLAALAALALGLVAALGCGVKAAPRPPGVKAALRGERAPTCDGCEIPGPDAHPSPSTPSVGTGSAGLPTQMEAEEPPEPVGEGGAGGGAGADHPGTAGSGPW